MFKSMFFKIVLLLIVVLGIPGAGIGYWYYTTRPSYYLEKGRQALERGDSKEAARQVVMLEKKGYIQAARLLQGEGLVFAGEYSQKHEPPPFPYEEVERVAQIAMACAVLSDQPLPVRLSSMTGTMFQQSFRQSTTSQQCFQKALAELAKIQDDGLVGIKGTILAAECLKRLGEQRLAAEGLTAIVKRDPNNKDAHKWLALIYMDLNSADDAIEHFQEWARLEPTDGLPYRWIGFFRKDKSEDSGARDAYEEALKRRLEPEARSDVLKELAAIYLLQGNYQAALDTLHRGDKEFLEDPEVLTLQVQCLRTIDRHQEADQLVENVLEKDPNFVPGLVLKAQGFRTKDQPEKALPLLEQAIRLDPYNLEVGTALMEVFRQLKKEAPADELKARNDKTREQLTRVSEQLIPSARKQPWNDAIRWQIGQILFNLGHHKEARTWLEACLACNPNNSQARRLLNQIPQPRGPKGRPATESP